MAPMLVLCKLVLMCADSIGRLCCATTDRHSDIRRPVMVGLLLTWLQYQQTTLISNQLYFTVSVYVVSIREYKAIHGLEKNHHACQYSSVTHSLLFAVPPPSFFSPPGLGFQDYWSSFIAVICLLVSQNRHFVSKTFGFPCSVCWSVCLFVLIVSPGLAFSFVSFI